MGAVEFGFLVQFRLCLVLCELKSLPPQFPNLYNESLTTMGFPGGTVVKNLPAHAGGAGDLGLIPGSGRFPGEENGNPIQCSCLGNPMDSGAWQATGHGVSKRRTQLSSSRSFLTVSFYVLPPRGSCHPPDGLQMVERKKKTILGRISQTLEGCPLRQIYFHCSTSEHTNPPPLVILSCHGCSR